jgi:hypothetical protein
LVCGIVAATCPDPCTFRYHPAIHWIDILIDTEYSAHPPTTVRGTDHDGAGDIDVKAITISGNDDFWAK